MAGSKQRLVDTDKVRRDTIATMRAHGEFDVLQRIEMGSATDEDRATWKRYYSNLYARARREAKDKAEHFWLTMTAGNLEQTLRNLGLMVDQYSGHVRFADHASYVLKSFLHNIVLPKLEEIGITGVKIVRRPTGSAQSVLDFSHARVVERKEEENSEENTLVEE